MGTTRKKMGVSQRIMIGLISLAILFYALHATPTLAVRTCVFYLGHPVAALTSGIEEETDAVYMTLTDPPFETATGSDLDRYEVRQYGVIYIARFAGGLQ
ncbi:hypothetical protein [Sporosarcina trichiuri]|uniref:hypothetical protein n=1 Tax=Sporosarcina trichiuri TaxID=3056445 RepID=UPI0025B43819|nr:hypothetical protein [Sporosarcina sp. 0.2-SM1T-5]WJY27289.1 hypothetical protein QWT68_14805 [Sporosarcina sp. 0.2-SM1T-5]